MKLNSGRLIVSGVLQRANALNHNGRLYPKNILEREVQLFIEKKIRDSKSSLGELNHPDLQSKIFHSIDVSRVSHQVSRTHLLQPGFDKHANMPAHRS